MQSDLIPDRTFSGNGVWFRNAVLLLALTAAGCGTFRELPDCKLRVDSGPSEVPSGIMPEAKLVLAASRYSPRISHYRVGGGASVQSEPHRPRRRPTPAARALFEKPGAPLAICADKDGALLLLPLCLPLGVFTGLADTLEAAKSPQPQLVVPHGYPLVAAIERINLNQSLLKHIQNYARDSGAGEFEELADQGPASLHDYPQYHGAGDYVLEVSITERGIADGGWLQVSARGRLIRLAGNVLIREFTATESTEAISMDKWTENNGKLVYEELNIVLQKLARTSVDQWIKAAMNREHEATVVIASSCGGTHCALSFDGCMLGSMGYDLLTIRSSAGKHVLRAEERRTVRRGGSVFAFELQPHTTRFFSYPLPLSSLRHVVREIDRSEAISHCVKFKPCGAKMQHMLQYWFP